MKTHIVVAIACTWIFTAHATTNTARPSKKLVSALIKVESGGKDNAIGDKNRKEHAYGPLQIRKYVCDDVNKRFGTHYRAEDCLNNRQVSIEIFNRYEGMYATKKRLHHNPTDRDFARIWNGGPKGYKRKVTSKYWAEVTTKEALISSAPVRYPKKATAAKPNVKPVEKK